MFFNINDQHMVRNTQPRKEIRHHEPDNWNRVGKDTPRSRILSHSIKQLWLQRIKNIKKKTKMDNINKEKCSKNWRIDRS